MRTLPGFGVKTEQKILQAIREHESRGDQMLLLDALEIAERLLSYVRTCSLAMRVESAGEVRRFCETVGTIVLVAETQNPQAVLDHMAQYPQVVQVLERDGARMSARLGSGVAVELHTASPDDFFRALFWWTGAPAHRQKLTELAAQKQIQLGENGMHRAGGGQK